MVELQRWGSTAEEATTLDRVVVAAVEWVCDVVAVIGVVAEDAEEGALEEGGGIGGVPFSQGDD
jgi:hypothetical protein